MGPTPNDIFKQYTTLTGSTPLPPVNKKQNMAKILISFFCVLQLWAIAYHQCRWNYNDEDDVRG